MNIKRIVAGALPAIVLSMMPAASLATSAKTTFVATISDDCSFKATDDEVTLVLSSDKKSFEGTTTTLKINCNYGVQVSLDISAAGSNAAGTTNTAILLDDDNLAISAVGGKFPLSNSNGVDEDFKLKLTAADDGGDILSGGSYSFDVTMTLLSV